jgi:hypothetical protein
VTERAAPQPGELLRVALTGGIATGKSDGLTRLGYPPSPALA